MTSPEALRGRGTIGAGTIQAKRFFFVRHGETDWNREGRLQGQTDIPLNGRGRDQAEAVGRSLRHILAQAGLEARETDFVASPLGRTRCTMQLMRRAMELEPEDYRCDDRLTEISFGAWEGLTWPEIAAADPVLYAERKRDRWAFVPPSGESYAHVADRLRPWLEGLQNGTVVVSHGGVARALLVLLAGADPKLAPKIDIWQGRVLLFEAGSASWI